MKYKTIKFVYKSLEMLDKQINEMNKEGWNLLTGTHNYGGDKSSSILTFVQVDYNYITKDTHNSNPLSHTSIIRDMSNEGWKFIGSSGTSNSVLGDKFFFHFRKEIK